MTSSIRIAQVFPDLVGKKTRALWKVYGGMLKYVINYAFYFIPSSEIMGNISVIKVVSIYSEMIWYHFTVD